MSSYCIFLIVMLFCFWKQKDKWVECNGILKLSCLLCLDWNTLIVGKLSPWINVDSELETERRTAEAVGSSHRMSPRESPCQPTWLSSSSLFWLCLYPGPGARAELLSLLGSASLHDAYTWPSQCQPGAHAAESHPHRAPHFKCKSRNHKDRRGLSNRFEIDACCSLSPD